MANVRWEDVDIRFFMDGSEYGPVHATDFSWDTQLNVETAKYQGDKTPTVDASYGGERASFTLEQKEGGQRVQDMIDDHVNAIRDRTPNKGIITMVVSHVEPDLTVRAYRYGRCVVTPGRTGRMDSKNQIRLQAVIENAERIQ